jgi:PhnB protein
MRPAGYHAVTPRIVVRAEDLERQVAFFRDVLGATGERRDNAPAELAIGDSRVMVSGAGERDCFAAFLYIYVDDADACYERAIERGATSIEAPLDTPYGDRRAMVRDPFGNLLQLAHRP